ncbi:hypothetical protein P7C71_g5929, partial [Lecanoromycetidae sp. Uapishka_2]
MHYSTLLLPALLPGLSLATYVLEDDYPASSFFSEFTFFTSAAQSDGLINTNNNQVYMGVDSTNVASGSGRTSVRITSNTAYNHGLFILDLAHMPGGICGTWPAYWLVGPNWPNEGEIDIIEGVNDGANNAMTLHTSDNCTITDDGGFTGTLGDTNCYVYASGQPSNAGCSIENQNTQSYGTDFNNIGGGVIATEWTSSDINIWFFPRGSTPADITNGDPDPTTWGEPVAQFQGGCDIDSHFQNQQIVFDTTFCGDWAGAAWASSSYCSSLASSCQDYVQNNPSAFANAYWLVNSLQVYQSDGTPAPVAHASPDVVQAKNKTLPLLTQPLAMGGGVPPAGKVRRRWSA